MTTITIDDISGKARDAGTSLTNALPPSVTDAGQKAYDSVAGGAQWYIERWEDLIAEAREMRASAELDDIPAEDFLAKSRSKPKSTRTFPAAYAYVRTVERSDGWRVNAQNYWLA